MTITPKKEKQIGIKLDEEMYNKIIEQVKQNNTSISTEIRSMIKFYFEIKEKTK